MAVMSGWAQAAPRIGLEPLEMLKYFQVGQPLDEILSQGVRPLTWLTDGNYREPKAGEWGVLITEAKERGVSYRFQIQDRKVRYAQFEFRGDDVFKRVVPILRDKYGELESTRNKEGDLGEEVIYRGAEGPVNFKVVKLNQEAAELLQCRFWVEGTIGTEGYQTDLDRRTKARKVGLPRGFEVLKKFALGMSLAELRGIGVKANQWLTKGESGLPAAGEWGISKEPGRVRYANYEFQLLGKEVRFGAFAFPGDGVQKELMVWLKKQGSMEERKTEGTFGAETVYEVTEAKIQFKVIRLKEAFVKQRNCEVWISGTIGEEGYRASTQKP